MKRKMFTRVPVMLRTNLGLLACLVLSQIVAPVFAGDVTRMAPDSLRDLVTLGDSSSEHAHELSADQSDVIAGAMNTSARRLLSGSGEPWEGGRFSFILKVDPDAQNYLTSRFWGDDVDENYLILFCEGKQVGYRHLGDIDVLNLPDEQPRYNGRFFYTTTPLPLSMTRGKQSVRLEVRATGRIWGYGTNFDQYQKPMVKPSRGIYRLYTHIDGCFTPLPDEPQGQAPVTDGRPSAGAEVLDAVKKRVNDSVTGLLNAKKSVNQTQIQFLAKAYFVTWTPAYQNPRVISQLVSCIDERYRSWKADPEAVWNDKGTWNPGWFALGPAGDAIRLLRAALNNSDDLNQRIDGEKTRRAAWAEMFGWAVAQARRERRWLANQAMITDLNLYLTNRGLAVLESDRALPESQAMQYLYQSAGVVPWLGPEDEQGPTRPFGSNFFQVTAMGLTRERGYVGGYGEGGTGLVADIYDATCESGAQGDPQLRVQLIKMVRARAAFRYPMLDDDGFPTMRLETAIGWRDTHMPGEVTYLQRPGGEQSLLSQAALTLDRHAVGYAQQMLADQQFFAVLDRILRRKSARDTYGLLHVPDQYELIRSEPVSPHRLPMSWDQPNFVFADPGVGVVAIKHDREILYVSLYWRSAHAINFLARTHYLTPTYQQVAVVREDVKFEASGQIYKRPDWINFGFGNGGKHIHYPADIKQAYADEELPIAKGPADVMHKPGDESYWAGKGDFYTLQYGPYLIAMNTTAHKTFELSIPERFRRSKDVTTGQSIEAAMTAYSVEPGKTVVLRVDQTRD